MVCPPIRHANNPAEPIIAAPIIAEPIIAELLAEPFGLCRYLDQQKPGGCSEYSLEGMWECFYNVEPLQGLSPAQSKYVLGGQGCQWSEGINVHNFDARTFTNLAAVAERLWSPQAMDSKVKTQATSARLVDQICRMNARGIDANPIEPSFCPMGDWRGWD